LDIGMPGMTGYEVARRIRSQPWGSETALFALTGWGQSEDIERARAAGFDEHMTKPVELARLTELLAHYRTQEKVPSALEQREKWINGSSDATSSNGSEA
jgi:CheY-like chemotaxis protein